MAELAVVVVVVVLMLHVDLPWLHRMFTSSKL